MTIQHALAAVAVACACAGCTHSDVVLSQPKPLVVDVNLNGKLTLDIQNATRDMSYIAGQPAPKPVQVQAVVPPAAIPAATQPATPAAEKPAAKGSQPQSQLWPRRGSVVTLDIPAPRSMAGKAALLQKLKSDFPQVQHLLNLHVVGEAHTGLLSPRKGLTAAQQQLVNTENATRSALYALLAARDGKTVAAEGLSFFVARLPYIKAGDWVQQFNKQQGQWQWVHWHG